MLFLLVYISMLQLAQLLLTFTKLLFLKCQKCFFVIIYHFICALNNSFWVLETLISVFSKFF